MSSECLGSQQADLARLCVPDQSVSDDIDLASLLYWPLQQLHQYSRVLLKLEARFDVVRETCAIPASSFCACIPFSLSTLDDPSFSFNFSFSFSKFIHFPHLLYIKMYNTRAPHK